MFAIGTIYKIKEVAGDGSGGVIESFNCKIVAVDGSLIKIDQFGKERVINTSSSQFVGAEPQD